METLELQRWVRRGDLAGVSELLAREDGLLPVNQPDRSGSAPLILAIESLRCSVDMVRLLLENGADLRHLCMAESTVPVSIVTALGRGDLGIVRMLVEVGADIIYDRKGYTALIDAVHRRDVVRDDRLIELLQFLIGRGVELNAITEYAESVQRVLSRIGRFDAVKHLLDAGANHVEKSACTGDVIGQFANSSECLEIIRALGAVVVRGDQDENPGERVRLNDAQRNFLKSLPLETAVDGSFTIVHSSLYEPQGWKAISTLADAAASFEKQKLQLCFFGHTHVPEVFIEDTEIHHFAYKRLEVIDGKRYRAAWKGISAGKMQMTVDAATDQVIQFWKLSDFAPYPFRVGVDS